MDTPILALDKCTADKARFIIVTCLFKKKFAL